MTKIIDSNILDDGDGIQIETDRTDDFKYIFLCADDLEDIAKWAEHL